MSAVTRRSTSQPKEITRELIAQWEQLRPALKALNDATLTMNRGEEITKERCVALCGGDEKLFKNMGKYWKESLLWLRGVTVEYVHATKAYRLIEVERHLVDRTNRVMRSAEKKHRTEALRLALIRDDDFNGNDHQRQLRALLMKHHNDTAGKIEGQREMARIALVQPETLPRIV